VTPPRPKVVTGSVVQHVAADWVKQTLPQLSVSPPEVVEGEVILHLGG